MGFVFPDDLVTALRQSWEFLQRAWAQGVFGAGYESLLYAAGALLVALILRGLFAHWVIGAIRAAAASTRNKLDDALVDALREPLKLVFVIVGLDVALHLVTVAPEARAIGEQIIRSLIAVAVFWALHRAAASLRLLMEPLGHALSPSAVDWMVKALQLTFLAVGAAAVLQLWGVQVGPLLAGFGIFGVAVALGAQDLFKNLIAGIAVMTEQRFTPGDWILVEGVVEGTVEQINFRSTVVRRFDKGPVYVPNAVFADNAVTNFSRMTSRRIYWTIGVEYGATTDQLKAIVTRIDSYLRAHNAFVQPPDGPLFVHVDRFGESAINIMVYCFTKTTDWGEWLRVKEQLAYEIKAIVEDEGGAFAFPSRTLYFADAAGPAEPFRPPLDRAPAGRERAVEPAPASAAN